MANHLQQFLILLVILQIFGQFVKIECKPEAKKGKGKAFGAGILAGGLAGAAVGHILTRPNNPTEIHHHHHIVDNNAAAPNTANIPSPVAVPAPRPSTIIERGATLSNGCYVQTIKEPNPYDVKSFIETEQLICPQNAPAPPAPTYVQPVPVVPQPQPVVPAIHTIPTPVQVQPAAPIENSPSQQNSDIPVNSPSNPVQIVPAIAQQLPQPAVVNTAQPVAPQAPAPLGPAQVIVLSKKTGLYEDDKKKKNSGNRLSASSCGVLLMSILFLHLF